MTSVALRGPGPILIAAGGTGGHMFPALAVADALRRRGRAIAILTDARGARYVPEGAARIIRAASPSGGVLASLRGMATLALGAWQSRRAMGELRPEAAAFFGGYAAVPTALAAALRRTPYLVHEQNAVFGKANRLIARFARAVALSFEPTRALPELRHALRLVTGNPVRPGFTLPEPANSDGRQRRILVLGGSQGAKVFSDVVPAAVARLPADLRARLEIAQQCRPEDLDRVAAAYAAIPFRCELSSFFADVPQRMARADLVIARSGASTIAELLALARPSLLVPYPFAADDHQSANARALAEAGAARFMPQPDATPDALARELAALLTAPERLEGMARAATGLARPDAAERLADAILALASHGDRP